MPIEVIMPALSPTMQKGKLANWQVKVGDKVEAGDVLAEIETDKALVELEAAADGEVGKLLIDAGTADVPVNTPIAYLLSEGEDASAIQEAIANAKAATKEVAKEVPLAEPMREASPSNLAAPNLPPANVLAVQGVRLLASPLARRMALENGLRLEDIPATGPNGRVIKRDIEAALQHPARQNHQQTQQQSVTSNKAALLDPRLFFAEDEYEVEEFSPMMASIAARLQISKQEIPHYQVSMDVPLDKVMALRVRANEHLAEIGEKLSLNDFIVKASAMALMEVPQINRGFAGDAILQYKNADISVAVALSGGGLMTPIVKSAQTKSVRAIAKEIKDLAARAGEMRLKPEEYEGGTFSVSNLGMFGVAEFNAIINPPQSAILAIGGAKEKLVMGENGVEQVQEMRVTLSSDHRVINGAQAANFLVVLRDYLAAPLNLLF